MATKFLRKIILEELQKVLEEQTIPGAAPGQTFTPIPQAGPSGMSYGSPEISKPKPTLTPKQRYKRAVKNLQKQLVRIGTPDVNVNGDIEDLGTFNGIKTLYPGMGEFYKGTNTTEKIERLTNFVSKKPSGYYNVAQQLRFDDSGGKSTSASPLSSASSSASVSPSADIPTYKNTEEEEAALKVPYSLGGTAEEKAAATEKARKEREAETAVRKNLKAQGFQESIAKEVQKLLRNI